MTSSDAPKGTAAAGPTMEVAAKPAAPEPGGTEWNAMLRFTLVTGAWFVGLFGLMRLPWVERAVLTPFAEVQQRVADQLTGRLRTWSMPTRAAAGATRWRCARERSSRSRTRGARGCEARRSASRSSRP